MASSRESYAIGYMEHWRERFDYVLVINAQTPDNDSEAAVPDLRLLTDRGFARLYQVLRDGTAQRVEQPQVPLASTVD